CASSQRPGLVAQSRGLFSATSYNRRKLPIFKHLACIIRRSIRRRGGWIGVAIFRKSTTFALAVCGALERSLLGVAEALQALVSDFGEDAIDFSFLTRESVGCGGTFFGGAARGPCRFATRRVLQAGGIRKVAVVCDVVSAELQHEVLLVACHEAEGGDQHQRQRLGVKPENHQAAGTSHAQN